LLNNFLGRLLTTIQLTVVVLKGWLTGKGMDTTGKKSDLVDRVEGYFEKKR
jgi:ATP-dependent DNA helicase 2 subunit 1